MARQCNVEVKDRREAVLCLLRREESAAVIARRLGVSEPTLYRWRDEFMAGGEAALANGSGKKGADPQMTAWSSMCQALMASAEFRYVY